MPSFRRALRGAASAAAAAAALTGCRATVQVRNDARLLSLYTAGTQGEAERFAASRDLVTAARLRALGALDESAQRAEQDAATQLLVWRLTADTTRLTLYQGVLDGTALAERQQREAAARRDEHERAAASARGGAAVRSAALSRAAQSLARLAEPPDAAADLEFYAGFFAAVRRGLQQTQAAAASDAGQAAAAASVAAARPAAKPAAPARAGTASPAAEPPAPAPPAGPR